MNLITNRKDKKMRTIEISCLSSKYNELRRGLKITNESHGKYFIHWIHLIWFAIRFCTYKTPN
jgi:hypothetical protein